jgi:hypothetical protein
VYACTPIAKEASVDQGEDGETNPPKTENGTTVTDGDKDDVSTA